MPLDREALRHCLATLAYRAAKAVRGAPDDFSAFKVNDSTRTPGEILAHMGDLMDWGLSMSRGTPAWNNSSPLVWKDEVTRFFSALTAWDNYLKSDALLHYPEDKLFQGPIADALTHSGQISLLRRMAGIPVRGESYNRAQIEIGRTGPDQEPPDPRYEFD
jgi:hypothetical protein